MAIEGQISSILNGGEWGVPGGNHIEKKKCWEDDVMMFRSWMLFIVAQECNKCRREEGGHRLRLGTSQPTRRDAGSGFYLENFVVGKDEEDLQAERVRCRSRRSRKWSCETYYVGNQLEAGVPKDGGSGQNKKED